MNNINDLPKDIPDTVHAFQIDLQGAVTKKRFLGDFKCKIPNIQEQCLIDKHRAALNGEMAPYLDPGVIKIHKMIAYLRYTLTEYPNFWKHSDLGYALRDPNVIEYVYDTVIAFEEQWYKTIWGEVKEDESDEEEEKETGSVS